MKTRQDPRHKRRQLIIKELFKLQFHNQKVSEYTKTIIKHIAYIDSQIQKAAPEFPVDKINRVDLAILRLSVFEIMIERKEPRNVIIDEAVELAKEYSSDSSPGFVNGVLGKIIMHEKLT